MILKKITLAAPKPLFSYNEAKCIEKPLKITFKGIFSVRVTFEEKAIPNPNQFPLLFCRDRSGQ